jgi:hypothetical protein
MTLLPVAVLPLTLLAGSGEPPGAALARATAYARMILAHKIVTDAQLIKDIAAKNAMTESAETIRRRDVEWQGNPASAIRRELTSNPCAIRLRALTQTDPIVVEAFLMDNRGGLVCSTVETEDYWQGDEDKWIKTYRDGGRMFLDEPHLDINTNTFAVQLNVLVGEPEHKLGALTLTLRIPRELASH